MAKDKENQTARLNIPITPTLKTAAKEEAAQRGLPVNSFVRALIADAIAEGKKQRQQDDIGTKSLEATYSDSDLATKFLEAIVSNDIATKFLETINSNDMATKFLEATESLEAIYSNAMATQFLEATKLLEAISFVAPRGRVFRIDL